jgi:hypothetical protein
MGGHCRYLKTDPACLSMEGTYGPALDEGSDRDEDFAVSMLRAAYRVLALTGLRPNQSNLFDLAEPYGHALWLAQDGTEEV